MLEMASLGSKILQIRSVEFAKKYDVVVHVRSSLNGNQGTLVMKEDADMETVLVSGVTYNKDEAKISVIAFQTCLALLPDFLTAFGGEYHGRHDYSECFP